MKISSKGAEFIKGFEGLRLESYQDQAGVWTIGYGTTGPKIGPNQTITKEQAEVLFEKDLLFFEDSVNDALKVQVNQNEFDSLVSFTYNVGASALRSSTLLKLLNANTSKTIVAAEFLKWVKVGEGVVSEGLKRRRQEEKAVFLLKNIKTALAHSIVAKRDTWLKRKPEQASSLSAEEKLFVPSGSAHVWQTIKMVPGEADYEVTLEAQPEKSWWFYPLHWKIINDLKPDESKPSFAHPEKLVLNVPYYSQRDNERDPLRTCFSSSCAMLLKYLKPNSIKGDDEYINIVFKYGDTTNPTVQIDVLKDFGVQAKFLQNGGWSDIDSLLMAGIPVPIGILHKGNVSQPTGGGHWIIIIGRSEDSTKYYVNDPFGELDLVEGVYSSSSGKNLSYSKKNLGPRWMIEGPGSGWFIKAKL